VLSGNIVEESYFTWIFVEKTRVNRKICDW